MPLKKNPLPASYSMVKSWKPLCWIQDPHFCHFYLALKILSIKIKKKKYLNGNGRGKTVTIFRWYWWEYKLVKSLWNTIWSFLRKVNIELPHDPEIPLVGIYLNKQQFKNIHVPLDSSIISNSQDMETT